MSVLTGAPTGIFSEGGAKSRELAKMVYFPARRLRERKFLRFFNFNLKVFIFYFNLKVFDASADGRPNILGYFIRTRHMTASFKIRVRGELPYVPPIRAPMCTGILTGTALLRSNADESRMRGDEWADYLLGRYSHKTVMTVIKADHNWLTGHRPLIGCKRYQNKLWSDQNKLKSKSPKAVLSGLLATFHVISKHA